MQVIDDLRKIIKLYFIFLFFFGLKYRNCNDIDKITKFILVKNRIIIVDLQYNISSQYIDLNDIYSFYSRTEIRKFTEVEEEKDIKVVAVVLFPVMKLNPQRI